MKTIIRIFASLSLLAALASCQMYEIDTQVSPAKAAASLRMDCDALSSYTLPALAPQPLIFNVSANTPWSIKRSEGAEWLTVSPSSSAAGGLITDVVVTPAANDTEEDRTATLTLAGDGIETFTIITIKQSRKGALEVIPVSKVFTAAGGPLPFTLVSNMDWKVSADVDWLSFSLAEGLGDGVAHHITVTAAASDVMERKGTVTVTAGDEFRSFEVEQKGKFDVAEPDGAIPTAGGNVVFKIRTDLPWEVKADKAWVSFDIESQERGSGSWTEVKVLAGENEAAQRKATVTVEAGGDSKTFQVAQEGITFSIVPPQSTEIAPAGEVITLAVDSSLEWTPESDSDWLVVNKTDDSHFTVTVNWNKYFVARSGKVAIVSGANRDELQLSQDTNFSFQGNCQLQEDGSVKVSAGAVSRVCLKNNYKYVSIVLEMGDVHFTDKGQFHLCTYAAGGIKDCELENRITLDNPGNIRLRANAQHPNGPKASGSAVYSDKIGVTEMNAITEYRVDLVHGIQDAAKLRMAFYYNGTEIASQEVFDIFGYDSTDMSAPYWFGYATSVEGDDTWYVVKSCDVTIVD